MNTMFSRYQIVKLIKTTGVLLTMSILARTQSPKEKVNMCRMLPNSIAKFRGVIVGNMGMTVKHRTLGHKPRLIGETCDYSSRLMRNEPDEGCGPTNAEIYISCLNALVAPNSLFSYRTSSSSCSTHTCRVNRPLRIRTCGSGTVVHHHIFHLWCIATYMLYILRRGLGLGVPLLDLHAHFTLIPWMSSVRGLSKSFVHEMTFAVLEDLTERKVIPSAGIASKTICLNASKNPSPVGFGCAMTYAAVT
ncbi:hypothetical protein TNCV_125981 [Trichonephila clavipes]|nr:hypothetical protein TNCV_125981 [Trichonephila clavipes]